MYGQYIYILYSKFKFYNIMTHGIKYNFSYHVYCCLLKIIVYDNNYNNLRIFTKKNL